MTGTPASAPVLRSAAAYLEYQTLQGFINSLYGGTGLFLFNDVNDNTATAQGFGQGGQGDGVTTTFQLVRTFGGFTERLSVPSRLAGGLAGRVSGPGSGCHVSRMRSWTRKPAPTSRPAN